MTRVSSPGTLPVKAGARRPEKRVTARSKLPQKKCTGLALPTKPVRNCLNTRSIWTRACQKRWADPRVIGLVGAVFAEADGAGYFAGVVVDAHRHVQLSQRCHDFRVEVGDSLRSQRECAARAVTHVDDELLRDEVELDFEGAIAVWNGRGCQSAGRDIQRHVPAVIQPGSLGQADLADDLGPQLQRCLCVAPGGIGKLWPDC